MPATIDRFLSPPDVKHPDPEVVKDFRLHNAYTVMLVQVLHSPYFGKFLNSESPNASSGKKMAQVFVDRFIERAPRWDSMTQNAPASYPPGYFRSVIVSCTQLLSSTLMALVKSPEPYAIVTKVSRDSLVKWLRKWEGDFRSSDHDRFILERTIIQLVEPQSTHYINQDVKDVRRKQMGSSVCGLPDCEITTNLRQCSKYVTLELAFEILVLILPKMPHCALCKFTAYMVLVIF